MADDDENTSQKRKRRKRLPPASVVKIRTMLESGEHTPVEVAELLQLPYFTVYSLRRGYSYKEVGGHVKEERQRQFVPPEKKAKIRALRARGATIDRLVAASGLSETTVKRICRTECEEE